MAEQMLLQAVPSRSVGANTCPECLEPFEPYKRAEGYQRYCGQDCRVRAWKREHGQLKAVEPRPATRAERILARLRQGPATGLELLKAGGGTRYGARLLELRDAGHHIETDMSGEFPVYRLRG